MRVRDSQICTDTPLLNRLVEPEMFRNLSREPDTSSEEDSSWEHYSHHDEASNLPVAAESHHVELAVSDRSRPSLFRVRHSKKPRSHPVETRSLEYIGSYDNNLMCPICRCPFVDPTKLNCDHYFCRTCITTALSHQGSESKSCPTCRRRTSEDSVVAAPKLISRILDELRVKCLYHLKGCPEEMPRGAIQGHIDHYCGFVDIQCPSENCSLLVRRKDASRKRCLHHRVHCQYCDELYYVFDIESHETTECPFRKSPCPHCKNEFLHLDLETHSESCPDATIPCIAVPYGCDFTAKRGAIDEHTTTCPLAKLAPLLKLQNERLAAHETALNHLRLKNSLLETTFATIQETLNPTSCPIDSSDSLFSASSNRANNNNGPFESTNHHLLCLHDSLREEVDRVSAALSELDAKARLMVLNESLRTKDEFAHMNGVLGGMRMQLHWLMQTRLQKQAQKSVARATSFAGPSSAANSSGGGGGDMGNMLSESQHARQDTKL